MPKKTEYSSQRSDYPVAGSSDVNECERCGEIWFKNKGSTCPGCKTLLTSPTRSAEPRRQINIEQ